VEEDFDDLTPVIEATWPAPLPRESRDWVIKTIKQVVLREREACARLADAKGAADAAMEIRSQQAPLVSIRDEEHSPSVSPTPTERHALPRGPEGGAEVMLTEADSDSAPFFGRAMDYSEGGVGIQVDRRVDQGAFLDARPANSDDAPAVRLQVRYCISTGTGHRIGCKFLGTSRQAIMTLLGLNPPEEAEQQS
jgi:hypothetical protein